MRAVAAATAKPAAPSEVEVLRSADAVDARAVTKSALNTLLLGLGLSSAGARSACAFRSAPGMAAVAGMHPAVRAARLAPAEALRSS